MALFFSDDEILCNAYRLYREEVARHIEEIEALLAAAPLLSPDQKEVCSIKLHTMKGGAGFFKLDSVREKIKEMEKAFESEVNTPHARLTILINDLKAIAQKLPEA
jgi:HPt (histidine-containing phosphotransfer) domain-containing protein